MEPFLNHIFLIPMVIPLSFRMLSRTVIHGSCDSWVNRFMHLDTHIMCRQLLQCKLMDICSVVSSWPRKSSCTICSDEVYNAVCDAVGQKSKADHYEGIVKMYFAQANEYMEERTIAVAVACGSKSHYFACAPLQTAPESTRIVLLPARLAPFTSMPGFFPLVLLPT